MNNRNKITDYKYHIKKRTSKNDGIISLQKMKTVTPPSWLEQFKTEIFNKIEEVNHKVDEVNKKVDNNQKIADQRYQEQQKFNQQIMQKVEW